MDINYELYKVFYYVAVSLSFSDASKKLYISQSAVSQSIKTLEKKLGKTLFVRSTKKVRLTPAGLVLFRHIEPAMNLIFRGENQLLESGELGLEQLRIAASDTICRYVLVPYLQRFHEKYPNVSINVTNATSIGCVDLLNQQKSDLIFVNTPNSHLNGPYVQKNILEFQDVFVAAPSHFRLQDQVMSLKDISGLPIMTLDRSSTTSEFLRRLFLQNQLELVPDIELSSNDLLIDLARIGLGIAFVPDFCVTQENSGLYTLKLKDPMPHRQITAVVNTDVPTSTAAQAFLELF